MYILLGNLQHRPESSLKVMVHQVFIAQPLIKRSETGKKNCGLCHPSLCKEVEIILRESTGQEGRNTLFFVVEFDRLSKHLISRNLSIIEHHLRSLFL